MRGVKLEPVDLNVPKEGYYGLRLVANGPLVPVRIWFGVTPDPDFPDNHMDRGPSWHFSLGRDCAAMDEVWPMCAKNPITEREWRHLVRLENWARGDAPQEPEANPRKAIDWDAMEPMF